MRVYLAGPLFALAERRFMAHLRDLAGELPRVEPVWPSDLLHGRGTGRLEAPTPRAACSPGAATPWTAAT